MSGNVLIDKDTENREAIRSNLKSNIFVEASAGSGKTTMLVDRMIELVKNGTDISKICAITFTKAAANEFYSRFKAELEKRKDTDAKCAEALKKIDLCFLGTIDAFCQMIISEHPVEAGISTDSVLISKAEELEYYKHFYTRVQKGLVLPELKSDAEKFASLNSNGTKAFSLMMKDLADYRNLKIGNKKKVTVPKIDVYFKDDIVKINEGLSVILKHPEILKKSPKSDKTPIETLFRKQQLIRLKSWENDFENVLDYLKGISKISLVKETDVKSLFGNNSDLWVEKYTEKNHDLSAYCFNDAVIKKMETYRFNLCFPFVVKCLKAACDERKKQGLLTYFDYQLYLTELLKKDSLTKERKLIKHITERHSVFLLDEFQDTNPIQAEMFFLLTNTEQSAGDDWRKCKPKDGSLFIVGDPKQSIYRFRCADVTSYNNVKKLFEDNGFEIRGLYRNFRSDKKLCEYFNQIFSTLMPYDTQNQSKYPEIPTDSNTDSSEFSGVFSYSADDDEPAQIMNYIKDMVNNPKYQIYDRKTEKYRRIAYGDIMIITTSKSKLTEFSSALEQEKIPTFVEGKVDFNLCPSLVSLIKIYSALAYPNDKMYVMDALINGGFGLSESEIALYHTDHGFSALWSAEETDNANPVEKVLLKLKETLSKLQSQSPVSLFTTIYEKFKPYLIGSDRLEYLFYALELLREKEQTSELYTLKMSADYLQSLLTDNSEERCLSLNRTINAVHLANLHKVKGLESPIVLLTNARKKTEKINHRADFTGTEPKYYCFSCAETQNRSIKTYIKTTEETVHEDEEKSALEAEYTRLLYVAATRAKNVLIVGTQNKKDGTLCADTNWRPLIISDFVQPLSLNRSDPDDAACAVESPDTGKDSDKTTVLNDRSSEASSYRLELPSKIKLNKVTTDKPIDTVSDDEVSVDAFKGNAALTGTVIHRLMELLVTSRENPDPEAMVDSIVFDYNLSSDYKTLLDEVSKVITSGGYAQGNGGVQDILSEVKSADEVHCEIPFCYKEENSGNVIIHHGVMDLVYHKDGKWHIVDYKTNSEGDSLDEKYSGQLDAYVKAFKETTGNDAEAKIYHIDK